MPTKTMHQLETEGKQTIMKRLGEVSGLINIVILSMILVFPLFKPLIGPLLAAQERNIIQRVKLEDALKRIEWLESNFPRSFEP